MTKWNSMKTKHYKQTKKLMKELESQPSKCECGYPFRLKARSVYEGFWYYGQVYIEYTEDCEMCGKSNTWKA